MSIHAAFLEETLCEDPRRDVGRSKTESLGQNGEPYGEYGNIIPCTCALFDSVPTIRNYDGSVNVTVLQHTGQRGLAISDSVVALPTRASICF